MTITTNGAWEAGEYITADVTDGDLSCVDLATSALDGTVGWQNNDYNELGVVNVTIDLGNAYTISSIDYNMGDCMRANTWGADSITTPLGTFYPSPGQARPVCGVTRRQRARWYPLDHHHTAQQDAHGVGPGTG